MNLNCVRPRLRQPEVPEERSAPFAVDKSENGDDKAATDPGDDAVDVAPRLPGVSADELLRLKQQMYRTDI